MSLTRIQKEVLIGTLLGDASLSWNTNKTKARIHFRQKKKAYIDHLYDLFKEFISTPPRQNKITGIWQCNTRGFAVFRFYKHQFYDENNKKVIPKLIHRWLTPRALAYWYMDDGCQKWPGHSSGVRFCTDCFFHCQVKQLATTLSDLYNVKTSTFHQRKDLRIYISGSGKNAIVFGQHLLPYIHPSMMYKIPVSWFSIERCE
jgi:hypothetical protein